LLNAGAQHDRRATPKLPHMRVTFDRAANAAYIYLREIGSGEVHETVNADGKHTRGMVNLDFDKKGRLIGIEVLDATRALPQEVLDAAQRI
jgi:uncharacterized protein YuzE